MLERPGWNVYIRGRIPGTSCFPGGTERKETVSMTKSDLVRVIARRTGVEHEAVEVTIEAFMEEVRNSLLRGEDVHLRGFGSFMLKHRKQKTGRLLSKNLPVIIPAHDAPVFKPSELLVEKVKNRTKPQ